MRAASILLAGEQAGIADRRVLARRWSRRRSSAAAPRTKPQVGYMVAQLLRLKAAPTPADAADGVAVALTHLLRAPSACGPPGDDRPRERHPARAATATRSLIETAGGVGYEVTVPLGVLERLPAPGERCSLYTELVVREDGWSLFGFDRARRAARVPAAALGASGFGPKLALALLSTLGPERTVRSHPGQRHRGAGARCRGIGKKKAERLVLELRRPLR